MKKFYETPAVEFTGFTVEDVITTSVYNTKIDTAAAATFETQVVAQGVANAAVAYSSYEW